MYSKSLIGTIILCAFCKKNPSAVRHPEETRPNEVLPMDLLLDVASAHVLSPHIATLCADATETTYMADNDLRLLSQSNIFPVA